MISQSNKIFKEMREFEILVGRSGDYLIHGVGEAIEVVDGVVEVNDVNGGLTSIPVTRNH